jgi:hypothetical protein
MATNTELLQKLKKVLKKLEKANADLVLVSEDGSIVVLKKDGYAILDVSNWTGEDWAMVDDESDYDRLVTAKEVANKYS